MCSDLTWNMTQSSKPWCCVLIIQNKSWLYQHFSLKLMSPCQKPKNISNYTCKSNFEYFIYLVFLVLVFSFHPIPMHQSSLLFCLLHTIQLRHFVKNFLISITYNGQDQALQLLRRKIWVMWYYEDITTPRVGCEIESQRLSVLRYGYSNDIMLLPRCFRLVY